MAKAYTPLLSLALLISLLPLTVSADPYCGDAPNDPNAPCWIGTGSFQGELGNGDDGDWYALPVPWDSGVRVSVGNIPNDRHVHLVLEMRGDGGWRNEQHVSPQQNFCCGPPPAYVGGGMSGSLGNGGEAFIGVFLLEEGAPGFTYKLDIQIVLLPDVAVTGLSVENGSLTTDAGSVPSPLHRLVTVRVQNLLPRDGDWANVDVSVRTPTDGRWHGVGNQGFQVTPDFDGEFTFQWNALGYAGDVEVQANVGTGLDRDGRNNWMAEDHYVLVGGTGYGVSTLAWGNGGLGTDQCRWMPEANACAGAGSDVGWTNANVNVWTQNASLWANANYNALNGGGNADACVAQEGEEPTCVHQQLP